MDVRVSAKREISLKTMVKLFITIFIDPAVQSFNLTVKDIIGIQTRLIKLLTKATKHEVFSLMIMFPCEQNVTRAFKHSYLVVFYLCHTRLV